MLGLYGGVIATYRQTLRVVQSLLEFCGEFIETQFSLQ
jgi:hypothetical protein